LEREYGDTLSLEAVKQKFRQNENIIDSWVVPLRRGENQMVLSLEDKINQKSLRKLRLIRAR